MRSASSKTFWLLLSAAAAFAVLAWTAERSLVSPVAAPLPPVRALDAPPSPALASLLRLELGLPLPGRAAIVTGIDTVCTPNPCTATDVARAKTEVAQHQDAIRPAQHTSPRVVAELPGTGVLLAWRNRASQLCLDIATSTGGGSSIFGPCVNDRRQPCTAICLVSDGSGTGNAPLTYLLGGTVSGDATALRVTTARTRTTYSLRGPLLRGTGLRIFMLDLGHADYRVLELLRGTDVVDSRVLPASQAAYEDCQAAHPEMNGLKACLEKGGAIVPSPSFP